MLFLSARGCAGALIIRWRAAWRSGRLELEAACCAVKEPLDMNDDFLRKDWRICGCCFYPPEDSGALIVRLNGER